MTNKPSMTMVTTMIRINMMIRCDWYDDADDEEGDDEHVHLDLI